MRIIIGKSRLNISSLRLQHLLLSLLIILPALAFQPSAASADATTWTLSVEAQNGYVMQFPWAERYADGTTVTLNAQPRQGFRFSKWTGDVPAARETENPLLLLMNTNKTLSCEFLQQEAGNLVRWRLNSPPEVSSPKSDVGYIAVAIGLNSFLGLKPDGAIEGWVGRTFFSMISLPEPNSNYIAIDAGVNQCLGLKSNGSIVQWGDDNYAAVPIPNTGFVSLSAYGTGGHSMALKEDGSVNAWGSNSYGQCTVPGPNSGFVQVSAGVDHSLGLKANGSVIAWGDNSYGQCQVPEPNSSFIAISAGYYHSIGLQADGSIVAWGKNLEEEPDPNSNFVAICEGDNYGMGMQSNGSLVTWGKGAIGDFPIPEQNSGFIELDTSHYYAFALKALTKIEVTIKPQEAGDAGARWRVANTADVWHESGTSTSVRGDDYWIEFLDNIPGWAAPTSQSLTAVSGKTMRVEAACTTTQTQTLLVDVVTTSGRVMVFPPKTNHRTGTTVTLWAEPRQGYMFSKWTGNVANESETSRSLTITMDTNVSLTAEFVRIGGREELDLKIISWGYYDAGGNSGYDLNIAPEPNSGFIGLAATKFVSYGLRSDGSVVPWGKDMEWAGNPMGLLDIPDPNIDFLEISGGHSHTLGLRDNGSIEAWGYYYDDRCEVPEPNWNYVSVSAGWTHGMALRCDGSIVTWGQAAPYLNSGLHDIPEPNMGYVAIAAGGGHNVALRPDGSIVGWGRTIGDIPEPNSDFIAIAAGTEHSLGLRSDGSIAAWGSSRRVPDPNNGFVAIAAKENNSIALRSDGSIVTWGDIRSEIPEPEIGFVAISAGTDNHLALSYIPPPGILEVNILPEEAAAAGARWLVAGVNGGWRESGTSVSLATGEHTIEFLDDIPGWYGPASQEVIIRSEETTQTSAYYTAGQTWALSVDMLGGDVISSPAKTNHRDGTTVTLTAIPNINIPFLGWSGDVPAERKTDNPLILLMDRNRLVQGTYINTKGVSGTWILR